MKVRTFPEITDKFFQNDPFTINLKEGKLTSEILEKIYKESNAFKNKIENFEILKEKYEISFAKVNNSINIKFYHSEEKMFKLFEFLEEPKEVFLDINNVNLKKIKLFSLQSYSTIKNFFSTNEKYIYKEEKNTINLKEKDKIIPNDIINIYFNMNDDYKNYDKAIKLKNNIIFNPLFLSSNFYKIFPEIDKTEEFELIMNDERKILLRKLKLFIESDKKYYWFIGSDGIGKSISLLYFSSLKNFKVVYFNLKLYANVFKQDEFYPIFYNDIHKYFLKYINEQDDIKCINFNYSQNINNIEKNMSTNYDSNISLFWNYLYNFIEFNKGNKYLIILDQYKSDKYDPLFEGLNKIACLIRDHNETIKIVLSSSMNNTDSKDNFIKNLDNIYNIEDIPFLSDRIQDNELINQNIQINSNNEEDDYNINFEDDDDSDNKSDCSFCQKMILEEENKFEKNAKYIEKEKIIVKSNCMLDQIFSKTQRDYYCSLVTGKEIYKKLLKDEKEYSIAKNFNYSIKYITKYLCFKKKEKENNENNIKKIIDKFYHTESEKMKKKIGEFYYEISKKTKKSNSENPSEFELEFKNLCKLRSYIIEDYRLHLTNLSKELYYFPMKYLNITLFPISTNYFSLNQDLSDYRFNIQYNNNFTRIQINCIINEIYKKITDFSINSLGGSALGNFLEIKIDETFKNTNYKKFGNYIYNCRNLFSLVPSSKNSPKTIKKHRKNEKNLITQFYNEQYYNKIIDDIDDIMDKNHFLLDENLYYFSQISFTGRAFDMAVLKKENNNIFTLFLYQASKNKINELKSKKTYILEANNVVKYLKSIYNIEINRIYLTFILPHNSVTDKFQQKLLDNGLNYIFFDLSTHRFLDRLNKKEIPVLELEESLLDYNPKINYYDLQKLIFTKNIWDKSIKKFLNRKLRRHFSKEEEDDDIKDVINTKADKIDNKGPIKESLHKIYINNFFNSLNFKQIRLSISKELDIKIKKEIIGDEKTKLKFLNNFDIVNIKEVNNLFRNLVIFQKNKKIYFYYEHLHLYENDKFNLVSDAEKILNSKSENKKAKNKPKSRKEQNSKMNISKGNILKQKDNKKTNYYTNLKKNVKIIKDEDEDEEDEENEEEEDEAKNMNLKDIALNEIKEKIVKIELKDLYNDEYEGKCFCFLIMSNHYIESFFD